MDDVILTGSAIVMELPSPVKEKIQKLRERFDPVLADNIPVEITIAGSSGLGTLVPQQSSQLIIAELYRIAKKQPVITARLGSVFRFPDSDVYALSVDPIDPFLEFHRKLIRSPIKFGRSPYPFKPHCSLHIWGKVSCGEAVALFGTELRDSFQLNSFALYQLIGDKTVALVERFYLNA